MMTDNFQSQIDEFFSGLAPEEREKLLAGEGVWKKQILSTGTVIFEEGSVSSDLYLILKGTVRIAKKVGEEGQKKVLANLEAGAIFGEGALLSDKPRSALAEALDEVEVLVLSKEDFEKFRKEKPEVASSLLLGLLKVVNKRLQWTSQELVTLYDVAQLMRTFKENLEGLLEAIVEKLETVTHAPKGLISLKNASSQTLEVKANWGEFEVEDLAHLEMEIGERRSRVIDGHLVVSIRDLEGHFLGLIVMKQDGDWGRDQKKVARTIAEQLGLAITDYRHVEDEVGRSKLKQQNIQF